MIKAIAWVRITYKVEQVETKLKIRKMSLARIMATLAGIRYFSEGLNGDLMKLQNKILLGSKVSNFSASS